MSEVGRIPYKNAWVFTLHGLAMVGAYNAFLTEVAYLAEYAFGPTFPFWCTLCYSAAMLPGQGMKNRFRRYSQFLEK
jgi:hypothetical protein